MIAYVTGVLGAGKSYYGARKIARGLLSGRVVLTNIRLVEGWEEIVLAHAHYYRLAGKKQRREYVKEIRTRYAYVDDIETLVGARLHGRGEGRGIRIIDEAHNEVNNREWLSKNQKVHLRRMALARKRGWDDYILAQHKDNTDMALRRISGVEIKLVNWRQILQVPFFNTKLLPFNLFLAMAYSMNLPGQLRRDNKVLWRELYPLGWEKKIYDTYEDFDSYGTVDGEEWDEPDVLWLPTAPDFSIPDFLAQKRASASAEALERRSSGGSTSASWTPVRPPGRDQ